MKPRARLVRLAALASLAAASLLLAGCGALRLPGLGGSAPPPAPTTAPSTAPAITAPAPVPARPAPVAPKPVADAVPRVEAIPQGHPNLPYEDRGETYEPERSDVPIIETGVASWYGKPFHGRRTASGERYDMHAMTAAHRTMPLPSYAKVRNLANGREVIVRVNDRGPFRDGRVIDLSRAAARKLGISGIARVEVRRLTNEEIRTGAWKTPAPAVAKAKGVAVATNADLLRVNATRADSPAPSPPR